MPSQNCRGGGHGDSDGARMNVDVDDDDDKGEFGNGVETGCGERRDDNAILSFEGDRKRVDDGDGDDRMEERTIEMGGG